MLTLHLLLDENSERESLLSLLRRNGCDVVGIRELQRGAAQDREVLDIAIRENRTLYTRDLGFALWAAECATHPGIILEYHLNRPGKDMTDREILDALNMLRKTVKDIRNAILVINSFRRR